MVAAGWADASMNLLGHWLDSIGHSILVSDSLEDESLVAMLTPVVPGNNKGRVLRIEKHSSSDTSWRIGQAHLEYADVENQRLVWVIEDGRRSVWSRSQEQCYQPYDWAYDAKDGEAFPWRLNTVPAVPTWTKANIPRDVWYDGARVAALLDIRQMIGAETEHQERLTHILMDHDLHPARANGSDYLIPGADSPLWRTLNVTESTRQSISQRISQIPADVFSHRISWCGENEISVGRHKISVRPRDVRILEERWILHPADQRKPLEIARLLALYSIFDNPLSNRRNGVHLGLDPVIRQSCDFELFASPLNACVPNGRFSSKWPHVEWRFGSIGSYPSVLEHLQADSVVCVNPPFTEAYLADVMARLHELKLRFRLRIAVPILEAPWRRSLRGFDRPVPTLLKTYYDATAEMPADVLHPTLLWEDPRCPARPGTSDERDRDLRVEGGPAKLADAEEMPPLNPQEWPALTSKPKR